MWKIRGEVDGRSEQDKGDENEDEDQKEVSHLKSFKGSGILYSVFNNIYFEWMDN